jgi:hypothetical protein
MLGAGAKRHNPIARHPTLSDLQYVRLPRHERVSHWTLESGEIVDAGHAATKTGDVVDGGLADEPRRPCGPV